MRRLKKYKNIANSDLNLFYFNSNKINKFKTTKWKLTQSFFFKLSKTSTSSIKDNFKKVISFKYWKKKKRFYFNLLKRKRSLSFFYDNSIKNSFYKTKILVSKKKKKDFISTVILSPLYRTDILLWRLNFFRSSYQVSQSILIKNILVNGLVIHRAVFLKKNDIVTVLNSQYNLTWLQNSFLFSFIEVDYYTNTLIILKDLCDLSEEDVNFFFKEPIKIKEFTDYLKLN